MPESIAESDALYALDLVKEICAEVGPGNPGSSQERARGLMVKNALEAQLGAENVSVEEFKFAPWAFVGAYPLSAFFLFVASISNLVAGHFTINGAILISLAAFVFSLLAPLAVILLFVLSLDLLDPLFKEAKSINVVGKLRRPGTQNVKRLIILSGHHDSAPANTWFTFLNALRRLIVRGSRKTPPTENTWLLIMGYVFSFLSATWFLGFLAMLVMSIIQVVGFFMGNQAVVQAGTLGWVMLLYPVIPSLIFGLFFNHGRRGGGIVPGAADNLSACALDVAMCKFLVNNPSFIPGDTEIRFISFGGEEAGLRGSRRYVAAHLGELKLLDTRVLNLETIALTIMNIMTSEGSGSVKVSSEHVKSLAAAAERAGVPYQLKPAWIGAGSDASPFSQAGIKATTILPFQMPQQMIAFYHQKWDTPDILSTESFLNALKLMLEWIKAGGEEEPDEHFLHKGQEVMSEAS